MGGPHRFVSWIHLVFWDICRKIVSDRAPDQTFHEVEKRIPLHRRLTTIVDVLAKFFDLYTPPDRLGGFLNSRPGQRQFLC